MTQRDPGTAGDPGERRRTLISDSLQSLGGVRVFLLRGHFRAAEKQRLSEAGRTRRRLVGVFEDEIPIGLYKCK